MSQTEEVYARSPQFNGKDYHFWRFRMEAYIQSRGQEVWEMITDGYTAPTGAPTNDDKKRFKADSIAKDAILKALDNVELSKVMECKTAKEMWDRLKSMHEGDVKVRQAKLQVYRAEFESLKMEEGEAIKDYLQRAQDVSINIRGVGATISTADIIKKVLRSLTQDYDAKVAAIEEAKDLDTLTWDELYGSLEAYEMRKTDRKDVDEKQAAFKGKVQNQNSKDQNLSNFVRRDSRRNFQGSSKCYQCGKPGHMARDCNNSSDDGDRGNFNRGNGSNRNNNRSGIVCRRCNRRGHFARECWTDMRNEQADMARGKNRDDDSGRVECIFSATEADGDSDDGKREYLFMAKESGAAIPYDYGKQVDNDRDDADSFLEVEFEEDHEYADEDIKDLIDDNNWVGREYRKEMKARFKAEDKLNDALDKIEKLKKEKSKLDHELKAQMDKFDSVYKELQSFKRGENAKKIDNICDKQLLNFQKAGLGYNGGEASTSKDKGKVVDVPQQNLRAVTKPKEVHRGKVRNCQIKQDYDTNLFLGNCYFCGMYGHRRTTCKFAAAAANQRKPVKVQNRFDGLSRDIQCYECGDYGHVAARCSFRWDSHSRDATQRRSAQRKPTAIHAYVADKRRKVVCFNCNNEGHVKRDCKIGDLNLLILRKIEEHLNKKTESSQPVRKAWQRKEKQFMELSEVDDESDVANSEDNIIAVDNFMEQSDKDILFPEIANEVIRKVISHVDIDEVASVAVTDDEKVDDKVDDLVVMEKVGTIVDSVVIEKDVATASTREVEKEFSKKKKKAKAKGKRYVNERCDDFDEGDRYSDWSNRSPYYGEGRIECLF